MPFYLVFELSSLLPAIREMLHNECPLARYYTEKVCIEYWFSLAVERIMLLECKGSNYPNADEYLYFNLNKLDAELSKRLLYPDVMNIIRCEGFQTFRFMFNSGYDGVIIFE